MTLRRALFTPGWHRTLFLRRGGAILLLLTAAAVFLHSLIATAPSAVVFTRDVTAGDTVSELDVGLRQVPADFLPTDALSSTEEAIGRIAASSLTANEIATPQRFIGEDLTASFVSNITNADSLGPQTMVPVRLADPSTMPLLHHGDTVSVISLDPDVAESTTIAAGGRIILGEAEDSDSVLVLLPESLAIDVAAASLTAPLTVVLTGERARDSPP